MLYSDASGEASKTVNEKRFTKGCEMRSLQKAWLD